MINWGTSDHPERGQCCGNDFRYGYLVGVSREERKVLIERARDRAQAYIHYLQTHGNFNLNPRPDMTWSRDGIALEPYIREARRGIATTTIRHEDVAERFFPDQARARCFDDSLGIGQYHYLDLHGNLQPGHVTPKGKRRECATFFSARAIAHPHDHRRPDPLRQKHRHHAHHQRGPIECTRWSGR